jgi:hypothetical protein
MKRNDTKGIFEGLTSLTKKIVPTCVTTRDDSDKILTEMTDVRSDKGRLWQNLNRDDGGVEHMAEVLYRVVQGR